QVFATAQLRRSAELQLCAIIFVFGSRRAGALRSAASPPLTPALYATALTLILCAQILSAGVPDPSDAVKKSFQQAQARYQSTPSNAEAAWHFARACFDLAEFATNSTQRAELAEQGIAACEQVLAREPDSAPGL